MEELVKIILEFLAFQAIFFAMVLTIAVVVYVWQNPQKCPACFLKWRLVTGCYKNQPNERDDHELSLIEPSTDDNVDNLRLCG